MKKKHSFSTFSLPNVLFATAACNFSTSERQKVLRRLQFFNIFTAKCAFRLSTSELQKVLRRLQFFNIFTAKCTFRHSGVQFVDIRTSKSAPKTTVFQHFHCQMCFSFVDIGTSKSAPKTTVFQHFHCHMYFSPQRRAICRHQNFKKCSEDYIFSTFSLPNVLFATVA